MSLRRLNRVMSSFSPAKGLAYFAPVASETRRRAEDRWLGGREGARRRLRAHYSGTMAGTERLQKCRNLHSDLHSFTFLKFKHHVVNSLREDRKYLKSAGA